MAQFIKLLSETIINPEDKYNPIYRCKIQYDNGEITTILYNQADIKKIRFQIAIQALPITKQAREILLDQFEDVLYETIQEQRIS